MLELSTVFVLGAGASVPYHFPTGFRLTEQVVRGLEQGQDGFNALQQMGGFKPEIILSFREALLQSGKNSVDAFLEHRSDLMEIGKLATAHRLISCENTKRLFTFDESWLRELYNRLNSTFDTFEKNRISFVTFNYDRSVEHFLFTALSNTYGRSIGEVKAVLDKIPIVHLHGRLGALPWQDGPSRPYEPSFNQKTLQIAADSIKIIHEDISDGRDKDFAKAKDLLMIADQVILMGFGYNAMNVERLGISDLPENTAVGTCIGLGASGETAATELTAGRVRLIGGDCTHFVREILRWK
jgi:hypothetical protein